MSQFATEVSIALVWTKTPRCRYY